MIEQGVVRKLTTLLSFDYDGKGLALFNKAFQGFERSIGPALEKSIARVGDALERTAPKAQRAAEAVAKVAKVADVKPPANEKRPADIRPTVEQRPRAADEVIRERIKTIVETTPTPSKTATPTRAPKKPPVKQANAFAWPTAQSVAKEKSEAHIPKGTDRAFAWPTAKSVEAVKKAKIVSPAPVKHVPQAPPVAPIVAPMVPLLERMGRQAGILTARMGKVMTPMLDGLSAAYTRMGGMIGRAVEFGGKLKSGIAGARGEMSNMAAAIGAMAASAGALSFARQADEWATIRGRIQYAVKDMQETERIMGELFKMSNSNQAEFTGTADLFNKLNLNKDALDMETDQVLKLTDLVGKVMAIGGGTKQQKSSLMLQFSQAITDENMKWSDLMPLTDSSPLMAKLIAQTVGADVSQLKKLAGDQKLIGKEVANKLLEQFDEINKEMAVMPKTFSGASTIIQNHIGKIIDKWNRVSAASKTFSKIVEGIIPHMESIMRAVLIIGGATLMYQSRALLALMWAARGLALALTGVWLLFDDISTWLEGGDNDSALGRLIGSSELWKEQLDLISDAFGNLLEAIGLSGGQFAAIVALGGAAIAIFAALAAPVLLVGKAVMMIIGPVMTIVGLTWRMLGLLRFIVPVIGAISAVFTFLSALVGGPVLMGILAIIAAIVGAMAYSKELAALWDSFSNTAASVWQSMQDSAAAAFENIRSILSAVFTGQFSEAGRLFSAMLDQGIASARVFASSLGDIISGAFSKIFSFGSDGISSAFASAKNTVAGWLGGGPANTSILQPSLNPPASTAGANISQTDNRTINVTATSSDPGSIAKAVTQASATPRISPLTIGGGELGMYGY